MTHKTFEWNTIATGAELAAYHTLTASLDPAFAARETEFYKTRTASQLRVLAAQAWDSNQRDGYVLARSYRAQLETVS